jgi:hypothetical protein
MNSTHERHITWPGPIMTPSTVALGSATAGHGHNAFFLLASWLWRSPQPMTWLLEWQAYWHNWDCYVEEEEEEEEEEKVASSRLKLHHECNNRCSLILQTYFLPIGTIVQFCIPCGLHLPRCFFIQPGAITLFYALVTRNSYSSTSLSFLTVLTLCI